MKASAVQKLGVFLSLFLLMLSSCLVLTGCGTTPDQESAKWRAETDNIQRKYASYSTPELRLKRQQLAASIPSFYWGSGIAGMIQQGNIEGKKKEVAEIDQELLRRAEAGDMTGRQKVSFLVLSDPPGARIEINAQFHGLTPNVITGAVDLATTAKIRVTPAALDRPALGFITGYRNAGDGFRFDPASIGECSFVPPGTRASEMGLMPGDRIIAANGVTLPEVTGSMDSAKAWAASYREQMAGSGFGGKVSLKVLRSGKELELQGRTGDQVHGTYYVQEELIHPFQFNNKVKFFDLRSETGTPIVLGTGDTQTVAPSGTTYTGTGFVVADGGYVLTCQHVIVNSEDIEVRDQGGTKHKAKVVASDAGNDLCLLLVENLDAKPIISAPPNSVSAGETIYCLGYPMQGILDNPTPVAGSGVVASLRGLSGDPRHLQVTVPINPGNSGGPILDSYGRWVAVASHKLGDLYAIKHEGTVPQGMNFAVKGSLVVPLFDSIPEVKLPVGEAKEKMPLEDATKQFSKAIVFVTAKQ